jgi:hypothetical protein
MGPTWQTIAVGTLILAGSLLSIIVGLVAFYAKELGKRVNTVEDSQSKLEKLVLKEYHTKEEIRQLLADLKNSMNAIHSRLDRAGYPHLHGE